MSRKSGKPPRKNPFLQKDRNQLLDELNSIQEMLGEAGHDVDEESIPTLTTEGEAAPPGRDSPPEGDAENQIPLLAPDDASADSPNEANERLRKALKERENPFLSSAARAASQQPAAPAEKKTAPEKKEAPPTPPPSAKEPASSHALSDTEMRALVDETLAVWLPKIERELRARLMEYLRGQ